jgi:hypothetical protein
MPLIGAGVAAAETLEEARRAAPPEALLDRVLVERLVPDRLALVLRRLLVVLELALRRVLVAAATAVTSTVALAAGVFLTAGVVLSAAAEVLAAGVAAAGVTAPLDVEETEAPEEAADGLEPAEERRRGVGVAMVRREWMERSGTGRSVIHPASSDR